MWAGSVGRLATTVGASLGVNHPLTKNPNTSPALLRWSRTAVAFGVSIGLVGLAMVTGRLLGRRTGLVAGFLGAVEPWFVGHGFVLHTDALVATYGVVALVALLAALRSPPPRPTRPGRYAFLERWRDRGVDPVMLAVSAVAGAVAVLTKLNALPLVGGGAAVIMGWEWFRAVRAAPAGTRWSATRARLAAAGCWFVGLSAVFVLSWPAMWVTPVESVRHLWASLHLGRTPRTQFLLGELTTAPGVDFYPVALFYRVSPWLIVGLAVTVVIGLWRFVARRMGRASTAEALPAVPWILAVASVPYAVSITFYGRHYDRYAMPLVVTATVVTASGLVGLAGLLRRRWLPGAGARRAVVAATAAALGAIILYVGALAPYAISYVDPLAGGQRAAEGAILLGWGEGVAAMGQRIAEIEDGHCDRVGVTGLTVLWPSQIPCGHLVRPDEMEPGDYLIVQIRDVQRLGDPNFTRHFERVDSSDIDGVDYATLYRIGPLE